MATQDEPQSLEHIHASELYPKRKLVTEDKSLQVPFPLLSGESVEFLGRTVDGIIALSNFRLLVRFKDSFANVPLGLVEQIEMRDIFYLNIYCKDATVVRCAFCTNDACLEWFKRLTTNAASPKKMEDIFAFAFHAWCVDHNPCPSDQEGCYQLCQTDESSLYSFGKEVERMQFDLKSSWRISYANEDFKSCLSYPKRHIVPRWITDEDLENVANFRALHRFPSVVWRDQRNGAVITRCSQPELGWLGWRSSHDESLVKAIPQACAMNGSQDNLCNYEKEDGPGDPPINGVKAASGDDKQDKAVLPAKKMLIIDARSYGAAFANRAKGGGCECAEYYPNCEIQFMNLPNIHSIRKSFQALRLLCAGGPDQANWLSSLENTKWLHNIGAILKATYLVVNAIDKEVRPVLVHCSDGWDRTSQIVALSELLLDPYYRTIEGFQVLVEREWLTFGHKFADRCGQSVTTDDTSERCPVFMQWLDCVHQVLKQFPCAFEFNEAFLVKLVQHTYSCLFGNFLCNNAREREEERIREKTSSVWSLLKPNNKRFFNYLYCPNTEQVLRPSCHIRNVLLWSAVYLSNNFSAMGPEDTIVNTVEEAPTPDSKPEITGLQKTRSCDDIVAALEHSANSNRRLSDPNIALDLTAPIEHIPLQLLDNDNNSKVGLTSEPYMNGITNGHISNGPAVLETTSLDECTPGNLTNGNYTNGHALNGNTNGLTDTDEDALNGHTNGHTNGLADTDEDEDSDIHVLNKESDVAVNGESSALLENMESEDGITNGVVSEVCNSIMNSQSNKLLNGIADHNCCDSNLQNVKSGSTKTLTGSLTSLDQSPHVIGLESSTDTIVEDEEAKSKQSSSLTQTNGLPVFTTTTNGHCASQRNGFEPDNLSEQKSPIARLKSVGNSTSISTSTTDLTDSHVRLTVNPCDTTLPPVNGDCRKFQDTLLSMKLPFRATPMALKLNCDIPYTNGVSRTSNASQGSAPSTPFSSRSSTCPPTPGAESSGKLSDSPLQRQMSGLGRHLDTDGLTTFNDPAQVRMQQLELDYQQRVESMERQLQLMRMAFLQYGMVQNGTGRGYDTKDDMHVIPDSGGSEFHSLGNHSNAASDVSWEQVDERDSNMTMWIPDHAVTHCAGCEGAFWMAKRKHHCRNCGKIFCGDCSNNYVPIPQQQLQDPARVCNSCYSLIRIDGGFKLNLLPELYLESQPIAAAASH